MIGNLAREIVEQSPWAGVMRSALAMYAMYLPRVERYFWPEGNPTLEREVIRSGLGDRVRMRRVGGGKWVGWDASTPVSVTLVVDDDGMSIYGTRCRLKETS